MTKVHLYYYYHNNNPQSPCIISNNKNPVKKGKLFCFITLPLTELGGYNTVSLKPDSYLPHPFNLSFSKKHSLSWYSIIELFYLHAKLLPLFVFGLSGAEHHMKWRKKWMIIISWSKYILINELFVCLIWIQIFDTDTENKKIM